MSTVETWRENGREYARTHSQREVREEIERVRRKRETARSFAVDTPTLDAYLAGLREVAA